MVSSKSQAWLCPFLNQKSLCPLFPVGSLLSGAWFREMAHNLPCIILTAWQLVSTLPLSPIMGYAPGMLLWLIFTFPPHADSFLWNIVYTPSSFIYRSLTHLERHNWGVTLSVQFSSATFSPQRIIHPILHCATFLCLFCGTCHSLTGIIVNYVFTRWAGVCWGAQEGRCCVLARAMFPQHPAHGPPFLECIVHVFGTNS